MVDYHTSMQRSVTLRDVCAAADVSTYTGSRALNGFQGVAEETRQRVLKVAAELGYVPNQHARNLKNPDSRTIVVLTANMANQYYSVLVSGIEAVLDPEGYSCITMDSVLAGTYSQKREDRLVAATMAQRVAAVVITYNLSQQNMRALAGWGIPLSFVDSSAPEGFRDFPSVSADNYKGSWDIGLHLAGHGYTRWAFVGHTKTWNTRAPRQKGFEDAAAASNAIVDVIEGANDNLTARDAVCDYLARTPRARRAEVFYASNTVLLRGTLEALRRMELAVPDDVAVVAFDDFEWADMLDPPVTVVDQDVAAIGRAAGSLLLRNLTEPADGHDGNLVLKPTLRIRRSCGCGSGIASGSRPGPHHRI
jgi:LacI family transcriptional regulator